MTQTPVILAPEPPHRARLPLGQLVGLLMLDVIVALSQKGASGTARGHGMELVWSMAAHPWIWLAVGLPPLQLWLWTRILSRVDLSIAYPLTSLSYPLIMFAATLISGEHLGWHIWAGAGMITVGVGVIGASHRFDPAPTPAAPAPAAPAPAEPPPPSCGAGADAIRIRWVSRNDEIPAALWSRCFPPTLEGQWWYATLEQSKLEDQFAFAYAVIERAGEPIGIAPTFVMNVPMDIIAPPRVARFLRWAGRWAPRLQYQRTLFVGSPCSDEGTVGLVPGTSPADVFAPLQDALEVRAREVRAPMLVWKDFPPAVLDGLRTAAGQRRMFRVISYPGTTVALPPGGYDAYLRSLKSSHRHHLKKCVRRGREAGELRAAVVQRPPPEILDEVFGLFRQTYEKGKTKFERLGRPFFDAIAACDASHFVLLRDPADGRLAAFMLCFAVGGRVINKFIGFDYARGPEWNLYFRLWEEAVRWACDRGAVEFQSGQTGYRAKLGLGSRLLPLETLCRHRNPVLNWLFARVGGSVSLSDLDEDLAVYLKAHPESRTAQL